MACGTLASPTRLCFAWPDLLLPRGLTRPDRRLTQPMS
jgi:hypothetical protein